MEGVPCEGWTGSRIPKWRRREELGEKLVMLWNGLDRALSNHQIASLPIVLIRN